MRFALRNKPKLVKAFGEDYYNLIVESLRKYFSDRSTIEKYKIDGVNYEFINVPNIQHNTDSFFQFAIINNKYDVVMLAYYSAIG